MLATLLILSVGKSLKIITFPDLSTETFRKIWPLPLMYLGNMVFGLGGTQHLSLPMMTVLRRFSILMTMIGTLLVSLNTHLLIFDIFRWVLHPESETIHLHPAVSVPHDIRVAGGSKQWLGIQPQRVKLGSAILLKYDLSYFRYTYVLLNDFFTAGNGVLMKKKLESKDLGKYGLMYYNSLFMLLPASIFAFQTGDLTRVYGNKNFLSRNLELITFYLEFEGWSNHWFTFQFLLSCFFGFILIFSTVLCTAHNSALTTTIIGCLKNILITYMGMFIGGDYKYSLINFLGLNISVFGSLVYTKGNIFDILQCCNSTLKIWSLFLIPFPIWS